MLSRLQKYLLNRISEQEKVTLNNSNIYILPTKQGLFFALILLLMLLTAINFNNSLIFILTFFLASLAIVSMLFTQKSLLGITFQTSTASPVYCQQVASVPLHFSNLENNKVMNNSLPADIRVSCKDFTQNINILEQKEAIMLRITTTQRGYLKIPPITISTTFPFGLFRAWSNIKLTTKSLVYPKIIASNHTIKSNKSLNFQGQNSHNKGNDDFSGLDKYIKGQSLKHIHWKAFAKEQGLYIKTFSSGEQSNKYWLDITLFESSISFEESLSILCYFVNQAANNNDCYGLKLIQNSIAINTGKKHNHECLKLLALS